MFITLCLYAAIAAIPCDFEQEINEGVARFPFFTDENKKKARTIHPALVRAVMQQESGANPKARSGVGARGLMQIMPGTAELLKCDYSRIEEPAVNINCGVKFLAALLTYTKGDVLKALSGYNGGTHSTERSPLLGGRIADNAETRAYVRSVLTFFDSFKNSPCKRAVPSAIGPESQTKSKASDQAKGTNSQVNKSQGAGQ